MASTTDVGGSILTTVAGSRESSLYETTADMTSTLALISDQTTSHSQMPIIPIGVIIVIILAALCVIMGAIYSYVYFTRISGGLSNKKSKGGKAATEPAKGHDEEKAQSTHVFLFKLRKV